MKNKKLLSLFVIPLLLVGCNKPQQEEDHRGEVKESSDGTALLVTDMQNHSMRIEKSKRNKVVCLGAGALRFYSYVADVSKIVGVEEIDGETTFGVGQALRPYYLANYDTFKTLPTVGKGGPMDQKVDEAKMTAIMNLDTELIVSFLSAEYNAQLESTLEIPVVALSQGINGIFDSTTQKSLKMLGKIFDQETKANQLIDYVKTCENDFASLQMTTETYYFGGIGNWGQTSMYGSMLNFPVAKYAKVKPAITSVDVEGKSVTTGQVKIDMEKLQSVNPDKIFMDTAGINGFISDYKITGNAEKYDALKALENKETYLLMPYNAYYSNLEIQLMSTYYVASVAHSDFTINLEDKMNEITTKFLGKAMYSEIKAHQYGMGGYQKVDLKELAK